ncbi:tRNA methyltransferase, has a role in tRNA modification [Physocladia obscura]|uniref:tRNA methyltransferase, has a role in tRNA modification n=1 Tax=Physocladia obscura TaxID=109957 RepID=A0AAD5SR43_9FUNG|nr:tRNA methyltransferase, has a role in tRNA modification [Physocladia obscura]
MKSPENRDSTTSLQLLPIQETRLPLPCIVNEEQHLHWQICSLKSQLFGMEREELIERTHVQAVYQEIAGHFSATRYKPWPVVENFLKELQPSSLGADVGCGNGKYLGVNPDVFTIGSDWSSNLASIAHSRGFEALVADNLSLPFRPNAFDFVLSIAVIHHFASFNRRVSAVRELARVLKSGGKLLIFVWALEQEDGSRRRFETQDVFVPWNLAKAKSTPVTAAGNQTNAKKTSITDFRDDTNDGENKMKLEQALNALNLDPNHGVERTVVKSGNENVVYQRYYHVFVRGELDSVVEAAGGLQIETSGYDRDNWYIVANKL